MKAVEEARRTRRRARVLRRQEAQKGKQGLWVGPKFRCCRWDLRAQRARSQESEVVRVHVEVSQGTSRILRVCFLRGCLDEMFRRYQSRPGRERGKELGKRLGKQAS
jgi:hypothetical protein